MRTMAAIEELRPGPRVRDDLDSPLRHAALPYRPRQNADPVVQVKDLM